MEGPFYCWGFGRSTASAADNCSACWPTARRRDVSGGVHGRAAARLVAAFNGFRKIAGLVGLAGACHYAADDPAGDSALGIGVSGGPFCNSQIERCGSLIVSCLAGFAWQRAHEIPNIEPFDQAAFIATLPSPQENEAGLLLRRALEKMRVERQKVGLNTIPDNIAIPDISAPPQRKTREMVFLRKLFLGEWANDARTASRLPLGLLQDPRHVVSAISLSSLQNDCGDLARLFVARALQLQADGDSPAP